MLARHELSTAWMVPGCDDRCFPRNHDPEAHEDYGRLLERETRRRAAVRTGPLDVDLDARTVHVDGTEIHLSEGEWGALAYYAARLGRWCPNRDVVQAAWGAEWGAENRALAMTVMRLRRRLGAAGALLETNRDWTHPRRRLRLEPTDG